MTITADPFPGIPAPPGARAGDWEQNLQYDGFSRALTWCSYGSRRGASVDVDGRQESDGGVFTRHVSIWGIAEGEAMSSVDARRLAALLITAADEMDRR